MRKVVADTLCRWFLARDRMRKVILLVLLVLLLLLHGIGFGFLIPLHFCSRNFKTNSLKHAVSGGVEGLEGSCMANKVGLFNPFPFPSSFSPLGSLVNQDRCCS